MEEVWLGREVPGAAAATLAAGGLPRRLAELLALRGVCDADGAREFLNPSRAQLQPGSLLRGFDEAAARLADAAGEGRTVAVVGDYDVDGIAATALLVGALRRAGSRVEPILAHRHEEGYGFQEIHVRRAAELGASLIVTVDCGTNSRAAAATARRLGLDLVVTDHHLPDGGEPIDALVVNPRQATCRAPFDELTGAGLAYKLAVAVLERRGLEVPWESLLRMACLGTIADVAPLRGENRALVALGLEALATTPSPGLRALFDAGRVRPPIRASHVAFRIAPRLNAAGRLATPEPALALLLERDPGRARELAGRLEEWNRERQRLEARIVEQARESLASGGDTAPLAVVWGEEWNRGVVGIAAARLARDLERPVILLAHEGDTATGSGRSVPPVDLHEFLRPWAPRLERFGGHAMAVGMTVRSDRLETLRAEWSRAAEAWPATVRTRERRYDLALEPGEVGAPLLELVERLEPFGAGNEEPTFRVGPLAPVAPARAFGNGHGAVLVASPRGGEPFELLGWGWAERLVDLPGSFEVLARIERDAYRGGVRAEVSALRPVAEAPAH